MAYLIVAVVLLMLIIAILAFIKRKKIVYFDLMEEKVGSQTVSLTR